MHSLIAVHGPAERRRWAPCPQSLMRAVAFASSLVCFVFNRYASAIRTLRLSPSTTASAAPATSGQSPARGVVVRGSRWPSSLGGRSQRQPCQSGNLDTSRARSGGDRREAGRQRGQRASGMGARQAGAGREEGCGTEGVAGEVGGGGGNDGFGRGWGGGAAQQSLGMGGGKHRCFYILSIPSPPPRTRGAGGLA